MDIEAELLERQAKHRVLAIRSFILNNISEFDELWRLIKTGTPPIPQHGAWVLSHIGDVRPDLLEPYFPEILSLLHAPRHDAVHRALLRTVAKMKIPEDYSGELYDLAINWIGSPNKAVALRIFSMEVAANIAMPYPELREELRQVIEAHMSWGSAGYKSRGNRLIKKLNKK